jgi:hypothetical protein
MLTINVLFAWILNFKNILIVSTDRGFKRRTCATAEEAKFDSGRTSTGRPDDLLQESPKMKPKTFLPNLIHNCFVQKSYPTIWATFVIFVKMPKVISRPMGENSPNPVTLSTSSCCEL